MNVIQIRAVRSFNRSLTQRIGALNENFLDRGRSLGQARLLYELGREGADLRDLRTRLGFDSGYLSRLLRSLERQKLVVGERLASDTRRRTIRLTRRGLIELREYNRSSDAFAESALRPLSSAQRIQLVRAMADVDRLIRASALEIRVEKPDSSDAQWCLGQYYRELAERFDAGFNPAISISATADELTPPAGVFLVAH
ncbi:MAG: MarR family transcriptional regulator, partial [Blastocatellia bacterium]